MPVNATSHIVVVEDDHLFRKWLTINLTEHGFSVAGFSDGAEVLKYFTDGGSADVILLDWRMPGIDGPAVLRWMREKDIEIPVIFLTALSGELYEEAALRWGAVDFIDKSRSHAIMLRRLRLVTGSVRKPPTSSDAKVAGQPLVRGKLQLRTDTSRAYYDGRLVDLTLNEFNIVRLLATDKVDDDVSYRQIYDLVRGEGFLAGDGELGYRVNVRSFIKRVRQKFRDIDQGFDCIASYPGFGYRWMDQE